MLTCPKKLPLLIGTIVQSLSLFLSAAGIGPVTNINTATSLSSSLCNVYNSANNQFLFTWVGDTKGVLEIFAAIYNTNGTAAVSTKSILGTSLTPQSDIITCYNSYTNQYFLAWNEFNTHSPAFSIIDAQANVIQDTTAITSSSEPFSKVMNCFDNINRRYFVTWTEKPSSYNPYFAILNENGSVYKGPTSISLPTAIGDKAPSCCYNTHLQQYLVTWCSDVSPYHIYITIYDANGNVVKEATALFEGYSSAPCCYSTMSNQYFLGWYDSNEQLYFASLDQNGNPVVSPVAIPNSNSDTNILAYCSYNNVSNNCMITSVSSSSHLSQFTIVSSQGAIVTPITSISNTSADSTTGTVYTSFSTTSNLFTLSWPLQVIAKGFFAFYTFPPLQAPSPASASSLFGPLQLSRPGKRLF